DPSRIGGDPPVARGRGVRPARGVLPRPGGPRVTLRTRLLLAQLPLAAGLALLGFVALSTVDALGRSSQRILQDNYRSVLAAQQMKDALERVDSAAVFRAAGRPDKADDQAAPNIRRFEDELSVQEHNIAEHGEGEAKQRVRAAA